MNYPTREHIEDVKNQISNHMEINPLSYSFRTITPLLNYMLVMHDEIDRLTAMLPKVIKPYIAGYESDGSPVICECGWIVGIMEDYKVLDTDEYPRHNYCGKCGAKIDWITFEA